jgi:hypothetical protein|eukprot:jgi/Chrpa1/9416/Chrysochromulina_OHIO_Genome00013174-RA
MPHLPFSSNFASYTVTDERGACATHDADGRIVMQPASPFETRAAFASHDTLVKTRATAIHDLDHSLPYNGTNRPIRRNTTFQGVLEGPARASSQGKQGAQGNLHLPRRPATHDASAFCGTIGHLHDSVRVGYTRSARPKLATVLSGEALVIYSDGPTYATPAPGDYEPFAHLSSTRQAPQPRWRPKADYPTAAPKVHPGSLCTSLEPRRPKFIGDARAPDQWHDSRSGSLAHTSNQPRLVDTTPLWNHAGVADATPGPGAYEISISDFAPRPRSMHGSQPGALYAASLATRLDGYGREHASVRGSTSCFGSSARSNIRMTLVNLRGEKLDYTRTPGGAMYSPLPNDTRVYMVHKGSRESRDQLLGQPRFTKEAALKGSQFISMSQVGSYSGQKAH